MSHSRPKVLTWHVHGNYLYYLTQADCDFYLPTGDGPGYGGRTPNFAWGDNVYEVPIDQVSKLDLDCVIFQSPQNYLQDQYYILSDQQLGLPRIYIEHDPPRQSPTDTKHIVDDPAVLLVHVTHFNDLMWNNGQTPTKIIEHGVVMQERASGGELARGIVVVNNMALRGRRLGLDVFEHVRRDVPLDLAGMGSADLGGLGEIPPAQLPDVLAQYRFFFNPIRYTSLGLAVCEAMMRGLPVVGLATTEMPTVIQSGINGYVDTGVESLIAVMKELLASPVEAARMGQQAAVTARERFGIDRFTAEWKQTILSQIANHYR